MRPFRSMVCLMAAWAATQAWAWSNHALASYRAFEKMPEVANASTVTVEPLEGFLRYEENTIEALLASQEAWARANLDKYPARPQSLAFTSDPSRSDEARRSAFLMALRVAPTTKFALYGQADLWAPLPNGAALPLSAIGTAADSASGTARFYPLKPGDNVAALTVLATATDEPAYGMDLHLWEDSPSEWGRQYGFGSAPFGYVGNSVTSQSAFHAAYLHENRLLYIALPQIKRTYSVMRAYQFSSLAALAFRTGHTYWGWRFAGISLHYLQNLTQPFQASLAPGEPLAKVLTAHALALTGMPGMRDDMESLTANRHWVVKKYQSELLERNALTRQDGPLEKALRNAERDKSYPEWNDRYLRDVVTAQASQAAAGLVQVLLATVPAAYVADARNDLTGRENGPGVLAEISKQDAAERTRLDNFLADLMANLGAHSRNALRGILRASSPP